MGYLYIELLNGAVVYLSKTIAEHLSGRKY